MPFLHYETHNQRVSMTETIRKAWTNEKLPDDPSRDELLVHAYKDSLHPRRTLDQFFYHGIETDQRDSDQVVWRFCKKYRQDEPKLFMVDQLWLWILGGGQFLVNLKTHTGTETMLTIPLRHRDYLFSSTVEPTKTRSTRPS